MEVGLSVAGAMAQTAKDVMNKTEHDWIVDEFMALTSVKAHLTLKYNKNKMAKLMPGTNGLQPAIGMVNGAPPKYKEAFLHLADQIAELKSVEIDEEGAPGVVLAFTKCEVGELLSAIADKVDK